MAEFIPTGLTGLRPRQAASRINVPSRETGNAKTYDREALMPPPRKRLSLPSPEIMEELVSRALEAFSRGIIWDRGSIVNVVL